MVVRPATTAGLGRRSAVRGVERGGVLDGRGGFAWRGARGLERGTPGLAAGGDERLAVGCLEPALDLGFVPLSAGQVQVQAEQGQVPANPDRARAEAGPERRVDDRGVLELKHGAA